jgi:hypothetical protein
MSYVDFCPGEETMPQPKSKAQILKRLETERRRLEKNLAGLSPDAMLQLGVVGEWSVKDVLAHLADWEARMPVWIEAARRGGPVETPEPGLTWKQLDIVNRRIYEAHRDQPLEEVLDYFRSTHRRFMDMVEAMPEDEMLAPGRYAFTGKGTVYGWLSGFAAHDLWGKTKILKWMKAQR